MSLLTVCIRSLIYLRNSGFNKVSRNRGKSKTSKQTTRTRRQHYNCHNSARIGGSSKSPFPTQRVRDSLPLFTYRERLTDCEIMHQYYYYCIPPFISNSLNVYPIYHHIQLQIVSLFGYTHDILSNSPRKRYSGGIYIRGMDGYG